MREASQASAYLSQALESLGDASNPVALFRTPPSYLRDSLLEPAQRQLTARNRRLNFLRNAVLFAALAVEAYANEFNAAVLSPADAHAIDRLPPAEKLLLGSRIARVDVELDRGAQPFQGLVSLQQVRNALVHPRPGGVSAYIQNVDLEDQGIIGPRPAANAVFTAALLISLLDPHTPPPHLHGEATLIAQSRVVLDEHLKLTGEDILSIPNEDSEPPQPLLEQMRLRASRP